MHIYVKTLLQTGQEGSSKRTLTAVRQPSGCGYAHRQGL